MTREERQALRACFEGTGFHRTTFTDDVDGTGVYMEFWSNGDTEVVITWGERVH